jgi:hypothetical protein
MITPAIQSAAVKIATGLNHGKTLPDPGVTTLLLEPVLVQLSRGS